MKSLPKGHIRLRSFGGLSAEQRANAGTLRALGEEFRVFADECRDPYTPCVRRAEVFVWSRDRVAGQLNTSRPTQSTKAILAAGCPGVRKEQVGDFELIVSVPVSEGRALVKHLGGRKRRTRREATEEKKNWLRAIRPTRRFSLTPSAQR